MTKQKFYPLWLALIMIFLFILQISFSRFTDSLILNFQSWPQVWRFLTSIFLHGSLSHLVYNLFALLLFGLILEKIIGSKNFLLVFLVSGILANIFSFNFYPSSLGASGAIFGVIGCLTILRPLMGVWAFGLILPLFLASIFWIAGDLLAFMYAQDNIGHLAHLSGVFIGLMAGIYFKINKNKKKISKKNSSLSFSTKIPERKIRNWENKFMR